MVSKGYVANISSQWSDVYLTLNILTCTTWKLICYTRSYTVLRIPKKADLQAHNVSRCVFVDQSFLAVQQLRVTIPSYPALDI